MDIMVLGIDLGKTVCSLAGLHEAGRLSFGSASGGIGFWTS